MPNYTVRFAYDVPIEDAENPYHAAQLATETGALSQAQDIKDALYVVEVIEEPEEEAPR